MSPRNWRPSRRREHGPGLDRGDHPRPSRLRRGDDGLADRAPGDRLPHAGRQSAQAHARRAELARRRDGGGRPDRRAALPIPGLDAVVDIGAPILAPVVLVDVLPRPRGRTARGPAPRLPTPTAAVDARPRRGVMAFCGRTAGSSTTATRVAATGPRSFSSTPSAATSDLGRGRGAPRADLPRRPLRQARPRPQRSRPRPLRHGRLRARPRRPPRRPRRRARDHRRALDRRARRPGALSSAPGPVRRPRPVRHGRQDRRRRELGRPHRRDRGGRGRGGRGRRPATLVHRRFPRPARRRTDGMAHDARPHAEAGLPRRLRRAEARRPASLRRRDLRPDPVSRRRRGRLDAGRAGPRDRRARPRLAVRDHRRRRPHSRDRAAARRPPTSSPATRSGLRRYDLAADAKGGTGGSLPAGLERV